MRVVIAEDHVLLADGIARLLAAHGHQVAAQVTTGPDLIAAAVRHRPEAAVVDVRLPPTFTDEGVRAALELRRRHGVPVLILSQYVETSYTRELLAAPGGTGYLLKDRIARPRDFVDALATVAAGGTALDPEAVTQLFARRATREAMDRLTPRERDVLQRMAEGLSNAAIGARMGIAEATVEKHVSAVFAKLDLAPSDDEHRRVRAVLTYLRG